MKEHHAENKVAQHSASNVDSLVNLHQATTSIAPPSYGIDFVDSGGLDAMRTQLKSQDESNAKIQENPYISEGAKTAGSNYIPNRTGLPNKLKAGIEHLSGYSMDDVRVHYNATTPAQLHAHAFAQGTDIHIAPGQERHLPHEAWHVVQQKQGRVRPNLQMKGGVLVNDDLALEKEADRMGGKAMHTMAAVGPFKIQRPTGNEPVQRYAAETLKHWQTAIYDSTFSARELLLINEQAQAALAIPEDGDPMLTSHLTTLGLEVEFTQQQRKNKQAPNKNALAKAHVIVATSSGYAMSNGIPFKLETDANEALEFVTPPLLAPVSKTGNIEPDKIWINAAREKLEFYLRDLTANPIPLVGIVGSINHGLELAFSFSKPVDEIGNIMYHGFNKFGPDSYTSAQVNYMTSLQHFMEVNRGEGDTVTEKLFQNATKMINYIDEDDVIDDDVVLDPYLYAICQKIREIPSILVDDIFSIILAYDEDSPHDRYKGKVNKGYVDAAKVKSVRRDLSQTASHIKDQAVLWLKASFHQIFAAIPDENKFYLKDSLDEWLRDRREYIVGILNETQEVEVLKDFMSEQHISEFIDGKITDMITLLGHFEEIVSDIDNKPDEQMNVIDNRRDIIGARPDTYVPTDEVLGGDEQSLFLVETRKTTRYLGLTKENRYGI